MFHFKKEEENLYTILAVPSHTKQKDIKQAYYKMAKKYHPDFLHGAGVSETEKVEAGEMFKKISKAYEVLSNPIARQSYDIENNFNDGRDGEETFDHTIYEDKVSNRSYFQPKQQTDFYYTKWTGYKKPDWYHPYNGLDARSEFLYLRRNAGIWPRIDQAYEYFELNRLMAYLAIFGLYNLVYLYREFRAKQRRDLELELLNTSFRMEDLQEQSYNENSFGTGGMLDMVRGIGGEEEAGQDDGESIDLQNAQIQ